MEKSSQCKEHGKLLEILCKTCNKPICNTCLGSHNIKGCSQFIDLVTYAKTEILPKCKEQIDQFEESKGRIKESIENFAIAGEKLKKGLIIVKDKLEELLRNINKTIGLVESNELMAADDAKDKMLYEYELLQTSIEREDYDHIIKKTNGKAAVFRTEDGKEHLLDNIEESINEVNSLTELIALDECLKEFNARYDVFVKRPLVDAKTKFVYGSCNPESSFKTLFKHDIWTGEFISTTITIPLYATINQIGSQVFLSGGYDGKNSIRELSEFVEESQKLVTRQSMIHAKRDHSIEVISDHEFVAIGGYNNEKTIPYCERYSISEDEWKELPPLNKSRRYPGTAFINSKFLYAIGGNESDNTIELLNLIELKQWTVISLTFNNADFAYSPASFVVSPTEILILCGNETTDAAIFNTKSNSVKKYAFKVMSDYYYFNSIPIVNNRAYILGGNGHMHIYDMKRKMFYEFEY